MTSVSLSESSAANFVSSGDVGGPMSTIMLTHSLYSLDKHY